MSRKLLIIIDMQKDFITGVLGNEECRAVVPNVVDNYADTQEGKKLPVKHCIKNTEGWELIPELKDMPALKGFEKNTFGSVELAEWIKEKGYTEVELTGVCTDICVISNAMTIKAVNPEVEISVDAKCCAGVTPESHRTALNAMKACQISVVD